MRQVELIEYREKAREQEERERRREREREKKERDDAYEGFGKQSLLNTEKRKRERRERNREMMHTRALRPSEPFDGLAWGSKGGLSILFQPFKLPALALHAAVRLRLRLRVA